MSAVRRRLVLPLLACLTIAAVGSSTATGSSARVLDAPGPWSASPYDSEIAPAGLVRLAAPTQNDLDGVPVVVPSGVPVVEAQGGVPVDVFLVPHQDDELLTMGAAIFAATSAGHHVWVTSYMDGSGSSVCSGVGPTCRRGSWKDVPVAQFVADRDEELLRSLEALGVRRDHVLRDPGTGARIPDGQLTPALAAVVVGTAMARFPGALITSMSFIDYHPDHRLVGVELRRAVRDGVLDPSRARFAMYRPYWQWKPARRLLPDDTEAGDARAFYRLAYGAPQDAVVVPCPNACAEAIGEAATSYMAPYGIGWTSVTASFESLVDVPTSLLHSWRTVPYAVGDLEVRSSGATLSGLWAGDAVDVRGTCSARPVGTVDAQGVDDAAMLATALDQHSGDRVMGRLATVTVAAPGRPGRATARFVSPGAWQATLPRTSLGPRVDVRCTAPALTASGLETKVASSSVVLRVNAGRTSAMATGAAPQVCVLPPGRAGVTASLGVSADVPVGSRVVVTPVGPGGARGGTARISTGRPAVVPLVVPVLRHGTRATFRVTFEAASPVVVPAPVTAVVCAR